MYNKIIKAIFESVLSQKKAALEAASIKEAKNDLHLIISRYDDFEFTVKGELKHREIKPCEIVNFIDDSFECDIIMQPYHGLGHNEKISNCKAQITEGTSRNPKVIEVKHPRTGALYMFDPKDAEVVFDVLRVFPLDKGSKHYLLQVKLSAETMKNLM